MRNGRSSILAHFAHSGSGIIALSYAWGSAVGAFSGLTATTKFDDVAPSDQTTFESVSSGGDPIIFGAADLNIARVVTAVMVQVSCDAISAGNATVTLYSSADGVTWNSVSAVTASVGTFNEAAFMIPSAAAAQYWGVTVRGDVLTTSVQIADLRFT